MPEINLRQLTVVAQPWFTYRACGPFTKNKERIHKFQETGDSRYIYHKKVDKALSHVTCDNAYEDFIDLPTKTASDKL